MNTRLLLGPLLLAITFHPFALPGDAWGKNVNVNIASAGGDPLWRVYDANGKLLTKPPQNVCLRDTSPPNCPATGATKFEHRSPGDWPADLTSIKGAKWIWAPGINGQTSPAANAEFTFEHDFILCKPLQDGTIYVAVDDSAEVFLNGSSTPVLTSTSSRVLSTTTIPISSLHKFIDLTPNTIAIKAKNVYLDWCAATDNYQCNPAGMVFGTSFPDEQPSCTGSRRQILEHGECEHYCPTGQSGTTGCCYCGLFVSMNNCTTQPQACTSYTFSSWSACGPDGQQTRTVTDKTPTGCIGDPSTEALTQACPYVPQTCTSFTYSAWGECHREQRT